VATSSRSKLATRPGGWPRAVRPAGHRPRPAGGARPAPRAPASPGAPRARAGRVPACAPGGVARRLPPWRWPRWLLQEAGRGGAPRASVAAWSGVGSRSASATARTRHEDPPRSGIAKGLDPGRIPAGRPGRPRGGRVDDLARPAAIYSPLHGHCSQPFGALSNRSTGRRSAHRRTPGHARGAGRGRERQAGRRAARRSLGQG
jgi:hypothetical protein